MTDPDVPTTFPGVAPDLRGRGLRRKPVEFTDCSTMHTIEDIPPPNSPSLSLRSTLPIEVDGSEGKPIDISAPFDTGQS